jgi:hypothetical protein
MAQLPVNIPSTRLFEGAAMVIPLSIPGCVSELTFGDMSGKKLDLSLSAWISANGSTLR